jgi:hypothetical protein
MSRAFDPIDTLVHYLTRVGGDSQEVRDALEQFKQDAADAAIDRLRELVRDNG